MRIMMELADHLAERILADDVLLPSFGGRARMKARIEAAMREAFRAGEDSERERMAEEVVHRATQVFSSFTKDASGAVKPAGND